MNWKVGIISDEISLDFEHAVKVIKELGASHVEVRNLWNKNITQVSDSEFSEMR
ncbi:MAG: sugar phosphate isomerase/epimerase, partial [Saccharolobus sp.]